MHLITGTGLALCLLASFVGWGRLVAAALRTGGKVGMPWEAAWGTCAVMLLGGILNAARLVSEPVAVGVVVVGCALFFGFSGMRDAVAVARRWMAFPMSLQLLLSVAAAFGAFTIFFSLYPIRWEPNDDALAYAVFPRQMLEAGWLNEPFSVRRILGYGGYQFLQALILAPLTSFELALLDRGVMTVLVRGRALGEGSSGGALDFDATLRARVKAEYPMALASAESYAAALAMIPTGSTVLSAVDSPFLLDQHQHTIVCIDEVGTVSPPPGLPLGGSPEALEAYLRRCSIDYVIFVRPENAMALYRTEVWQAPAVEIWKRRAPYFLWFFDSLEKLAATDRLVFENRAAAVLSLR